MEKKGEIGSIGDDILKLVNSKGSVSVADAAKELGIDRKDIEDLSLFLEEDGHLKIQYKFLKAYLISTKVYDKAKEKKVFSSLTSKNTNFGHGTSVMGVGMFRQKVDQKKHIDNLPAAEKDTALVDALKECIELDKKQKFNDIFYKYKEIVEIFNKSHISDPKLKAKISFEVKKLFFLISVYKAIISIKKLSPSDLAGIKKGLEQIADIYKNNKQYFTGYDHFVQYLQHEFDVYSNYIKLKEPKVVVKNGN